MTDYSRKGFGEGASLARQTLFSLSESKSVSKRQKITKECLQEELTIDLRRYEAGEYLRGMNIMQSAI